MYIVQVRGGICYRRGFFMDKSTVIPAQTGIQRTVNESLTSFMRV